VSGIAGIFNRDGRPVDRELLGRMTDAIAYRGPDRQDIWIDGCVGFGHTLLRTTYESQRETQPFSLDGEVWITADARVDGRSELIQKLIAKGCDVSAAVSDVELILHAYHVWGEECLQHLIGDFAFAIWDGRRKRLFCARDHLGVKPFYYARVGECLVFSNTLNCVRLHPLVSDKLNDLAIGDFLLFGFNQDGSTTTFADIQRLPPAHALTWSGDATRTHRYWSLPLNGHVRYKHASDYVDHFSELLRIAVEDRLRIDNVAVFMSGGLDSTAVAAIAKQTARRMSGLQIHAYTTVYDHLLIDPERHYAGLAAEALAIPIHYNVVDNYRLFERCTQPELQPPEPYEEPLSATYFDQVQQVAQHSRVALTGQGADPILIPPQPHYSLLLEKLQLGQLFKAVLQYRRAYGQLPPFQVRRRLKSWLGIAEPPRTAALPGWINETFAAEFDLLASSRRFKTALAPLHPTRPEAYEQLDTPWWSCIFEQYDAGWVPCPIEVRHPFFDIRLIEYLLAIPPVPWCMDKGILRSATRNLLPEAVRRRPKSYVQGDPVSVRLQQGDLEWLNYIQLSPEALKYIKAEALTSVEQPSDQGSYPTVVDFRPFYLALWLQQLKSQAITSKRRQPPGITNVARPQETVPQISAGSV
jgi:asparagine synthase (glutamine-hydrolysing)